MFLLIIFLHAGDTFIDDERKIGLRVPEVVDYDGTLHRGARPQKRSTSSATARYPGQDGGEPRAAHHPPGRRAATIQRNWACSFAAMAAARVPERRLGADGLQTAGIQDWELPFDPSR